MTPRDQRTVFVIPTAEAGPDSWAAFQETTHVLQLASDDKSRTRILGGLIQRGAVDAEDLLDHTNRTYIHRAYTDLNSGIKALDEAEIPTLPRIEQIVRRGLFWASRKLHLRPRFDQ